MCVSRVRHSLTWGAKPPFFASTWRLTDAREEEEPRAICV